MTLILLKLLQVEQSKLINRLPGGRSIIFNGENSSNSMFIDVSKRKYTHIFTSPEIAVSKKFKKYILDQSFFANHFCLLAVDEILLIEKWGNNFCLIYTEIDKI